MSDPLDSDLDSLYQVPADEFVAARNALSERLRKSGDKASAARVKALKRPTPAAWLLNQVWFTHPELLDEASTATERLREMHQRGGHDMQALSAALDAQRRAMNTVLDAAKKCGQQAGIAVEAALQRKLFTTLQAWLAGGAGERPGRMAQEVDASGFDAVAALGTPAPMSKPAPAAAVAPPPLPSRPPPPAAPAAPDTHAVDRAATHLHECERRAHDAARELEQLRARATQHQEELTRAQRSVNDAEATLVKLRARASEHEAALAAMRASLAAAEQAARRAREEEARARAALAELAAS